MGLFSSPYFASGSGPATASGYYADQADVEDQFGEKNVRIWSNLDNSDAETNADRVQRALDYADRQIDSFLRDSRYLVPLQFTEDAEAGTATTWAAVLAGVWLFRNRGVNASDEDSAAMFQTLEDQVRKEMRDFKAGTLRLSAALRWTVGTPTGPSVV